MSGDRWSFKITVVGDGQVGKTSLIQKFTKGSFQEEYIKTIGAQFSIYEMEIDGDFCELFFWDIAGQDEFHFLRPSFYKDSKAAIIVYSLEENDLGKNSLKHIPNWHDDILKFCGDIPIVVFANKVDLVDKENLVDTKILKIIKKRNFLEYYRTSAKTGEGVSQAFQTIIRELYNKYKALFLELKSKG
ncbi:MAG: GTP-binding protein [Promethearchaeota archaeon]